MSTPASSAQVTGRSGSNRHLVSLGTQPRRARCWTAVNSGSSSAVRSEKKVTGVPPASSRSWTTETSTSAAGTRRRSASPAAMPAAMPRLIRVDSTRTAPNAMWVALTAPHTSRLSTPGGTMQVYGSWWGARMALPKYQPSGIG